MKQLTASKTYNAYIKRRANAAVNVYKRGYYPYKTDEDQAVLDGYKELTRMPRMPRVKAHFMAAERVRAQHLMSPRLWR